MASDKFVQFTLKIPLRKGVEILVKKGEKTKKDQLIARLTRSRIIEVDIAGILKVKPGKAAVLLEVGPGRAVEKGQLLAVRKKLYGKKKVFSPAKGEVKNFVQEQGILRMEIEKQEIGIKSPVEAEVASVEKSFLNLQFSALVFSAKVGFGKSGWGQLTVLSSDEIFTITAGEGKIALVRELNLTVLNKLEALGAVGVVCIKAANVEKEAEDIGVLVLGEKDFEKVCQYKDKQAKVDVGDKRLIVAK